MLLYYITDRRAFSGTPVEQRKSLLTRIAEAAAAGVDYIQLREKDLSSRDLEALSKEVVAAARSSSGTTRVLINERTDIGIACGADGVHLPGENLPASEVRALWMDVCDRTPVIAVSAHSVEDVRYAEAHGADFAVLAPIFEKPGTDLPGLGCEILRLACGCSPAPVNTESAPQTRFPVLALGGVNLQNAAECMRAGAAGIAGIRLFQQGNVQETVQRLREVASGQ
jgi:thiamine-phosphate pyrophosphorylase